MAEAVCLKKKKHVNFFYINIAPFLAIVVCNSLHHQHIVSVVVFYYASLAHCMSTML